MSVYSPARLAVRFFKPFGMKLIKFDRFASSRSTTIVKRLTVKSIPFPWGRACAVHGNFLAELGQRLVMSPKQRISWCDGRKCHYALLSLHRNIFVS